MASLFFSNGSFLVVGSQVLWLAAFFGGLAVCGVGITHLPRQSTYVLPVVCVADMDDYNAMYLSFFAALISCAVQACSVTLAMWILGSRKRVDKLPPSSGKWCRGLLFTGVVFCTVSFACVISIINTFVFVRVARFPCLGSSARFLVVVGDVVAALVGVALFSTGSYIAWFCH